MIAFYVVYFLLGPNGMPRADNALPKVAEVVQTEADCRAKVIWLNSHKRNNTRLYLCASVQAAS